MISLNSGCGLFFGVFEKNLSSECAKTWAEATVGRLPFPPPVSCPSSPNAYETTVTAHVQRQTAANSEAHQKELHLSGIRTLQTW